MNIANSIFIANYLFMNYILSRASTSDHDFDLSSHTTAEKTADANFLLFLVASRY